MKSETVVPAESSYPTPIRSEKYTYLELPTVTNAITDTFVAVKELEFEEGGNSLSKTVYTYINQPAFRDHGRPEKQMSWVSQEKSTTQTWTYEYLVSGQLKQSITTESFDGISSQDVTDYSLYSGQTLAHIDYTDVHDTFAYDKLNRLLKATTALGTPYETVRQQEYDRLGDGMGSRLVVTDANGVKTRYILDGLGQLCEVEKQDMDDFSEKNVDVFRMVQKRNYNAQNQCVEMVEIDWLLTENGGPLEQRTSKALEYDGWGEVYRTTDSTGVVSISETDPISLTKTEGTEGQGLIKTHRNTLGLITKVELIQKNGRQCSQVEYFTMFECNGFDRVTRTTWPDSREVTTLYSAQTASAWLESVSIDGLVVGEQSFDGLGRVKRKNVGKRTTTQTYLGNASEPSQVTTHKGYQSSFAYEPALGYALTGVTGDDATDAYEYDPKSGIARLLKGAYSTQDLKHFSSEFLESENIKLNQGGTFSTAYKYIYHGRQVASLHRRQRAAPCGRLKSQRFTFDAYDNLIEVVTGFQDGSQNTASYSFSSRDPTQLTAVTNSNPELRPRIGLEYNANGCLTRDEQGRSLEYDSRSPLMVVHDMGGNIISQYHYDTAGRLVCLSVPGQADHHLFYRDKKLIASRTGDRKLGYLYSWSSFTSGEINPYAYCLGDPVNRIDPSGHWGFLKKIGAWFKKS
ncbi:hypothetical protein A0O28_0104980 [Trichoderma guizhouense]|uniref:Uncharacterized protein n=1 Tax=Trichoderma guizhouense TaxID=1491466 RepID=A0A1T3CQD0_9HYPO|nr:hypothetical protein A0O28_0104980 [Trichoderma guizhouense]